MLVYSWPLLVLGVAGILSQNMGQILIPYLFRGEEQAARSMVGIYGANIKIAIVMVMFTQAFRYAYEPFIFARARGGGRPEQGILRCHEVLRHFRTLHLSGCDVFPSLAQILCLPILLARPEGGSRDDGGRSLLRSVLQPFSLVQAY